MKTVRVFTKKKFIKNMGKKTYSTSKTWVNKCNGRTEEECNAMCFCISSEWLKTITIK